MSLKVLLQIPLTTYSGYGNDGIGICRALLRMGADVYLEPLGVQAPLPEDVAMLLTKPLQAPFDLYINHVDPMALTCNNEHVDNAAVTVGWTMWEYTNLRNAPDWKDFGKNWHKFDMLIGYDPVSSKALKEFFPTKPILTIQGGYEPADWPYVERDWDEENFYFCMIGVLVGRKEPFKAIRAFSDAKNQDPDFNEHGRLSLKTVAPGLHSKMEDVYPGLRIFYDAWPASMVRDWYSSQHVLLSPSRGEGKNMPALEFQSTGGTVIATNWGGHTMWLNEDYNYPLDFELQPIDKQFPTTMNADADEAELTRLMLHTFHNRAEAKAKGDRASQVIPALASWDSVMERFFVQVCEAAPRGAELWEKYSELVAGS